MNTDDKAFSQEMINFLDDGTRTKPKTTAELFERYKADVQALQASCVHPVLSKWVDEYWAPAHGTGHMVRSCLTCEKIIERKTIDGQVNSQTTIRTNS